jgi:hypothetical protein
MPPVVNPISVNKYIIIVVRVIIITTTTILSVSSYWPDDRSNQQV